MPIFYNKEGEQRKDIAQYIGPNECRNKRNLPVYICGEVPRGKRRSIPANGFKNDGPDEVNDQTDLKVKLSIPFHDRLTLTPFESFKDASSCCPESTSAGLGVFPDAGFQNKMGGPGLIANFPPGQSLLLRIRYLRAF